MYVPSILLSFDEFVKYYNKHKRFPDYSYCNPQKKLNEKQLVSKYQKYVKWYDKKQEKRKEDLKKIKSKNKEHSPDTKMKEVKKECLIRAGHKCEVWNILTPEEKAIIKPRLFKQLKELDPMHIISRSQSKNLYYHPDNIVIGMRYFHSLLDSYKDPITLKHITMKERDNWFIRIIGFTRWLYLQENK